MHGSRLIVQMGSAQSLSLSGENRAFPLPYSHPPPPTRSLVVVFYYLILLKFEKTNGWEYGNVILWL